MVGVCVLWDMCVYCGRCVCLFWDMCVHCGKCVRVCGWERSVTILRTLQCFFMAACLMSVDPIVLMF